jgi:hypothetical protein
MEKLTTFISALVLIALPIGAKAGSDKTLLTCDDSRFGIMQSQQSVPQCAGGHCECIGPQVPGHSSSFFNFTVQQGEAVYVSGLGAKVTVVDCESNELTSRLLLLQK